MEIIRNYLETMFQNLPNTPEVQKAKYELGQMMEDKYMELKQEGKTENEAVGIIISEFGNLDEIAQDLGIDGYMKEQEYNNSRMLSMQEGKEYIKDKMKSGFMVAVGTLLCILSPCGVILDDGKIGGLVFLFVCIAMAVAIFILSGAVTGKWDFLKQQLCTIDFATAEYVHNEKENYRMTNAILIAVGIMFCLLSFVPLIVIEELNMRIAQTNIGVVILLALIAIGVLIFIVAGARNDAYDTLLGLNGSNTMGGGFVPSQNGHIRYTNKVAAAVMSVYWPTVTCIYLCWSFISYDWHITWITWVIAAIIETFIKNLYGERSR